MSLEISLKHGLLKKDNLLILADENDLTWTKTILSIDQQSTLKAYKSRKLSFLALPGVERSIYIIWIKTGTAPNISSEKSRLAGAEMYQTLNQHKETAVVLLNYCKSNRIYDFLEGLKLASYQFRKYQTNGSDKLPSLRKVAVLDTFKTSDLRLLNTITATTFVARDLVNEVPNAQTPKLFSQSLLQLSNHYGFKLKIIEQDELRKLGFGGLLAVNSGSLDPPTFNILEWKPKKSRNKTPIILVGKGVVYDTGGLSLKPTAGSMDYMKSDMAGGAAVAATMSAAAALDLPLHIVGLIPCTDNRPGVRAMVPGDVITMYGGKTVEILNTDAEGRLILADTLEYAKQYKPELVIDLATLTGAAARSLGTHGIVYMGTASEKIKLQLQKSGQEVFERLVEFPLWDEYREEIKSCIADLKNIGGVNAGMITAGKFLEQFTDYPWLHLDIAGPAYLHTASGYRSKEGTGVGVRLLIQFLRNYQA